MTDKTEAGKDRFDLLSKQIGTIGGLIAALVGLNTILTTCSREQSARYTEFRAVVAAEEAFWRGLYGDYLETFGSNVAAEGQTKRLFAISRLADRDPPNFEDFKHGLLKVDSAVIDTASGRLDKMRIGLENALLDPQSSTPEVVEAVDQSRAFRVAEQDKIEPRSGDAGRRAQAETVAAVVAAPVERPTAATQVLAAGDSKGWDVDLFWCGSDDAPTHQSNYSVALRKGRLLAEPAKAGHAIGSGVKLGRVRLRVLPASRQGQMPNGLIYPQLGDGLQLRYEKAAPQDRSEIAAATAVLGLINRDAPAFGLFPSGQPTPFYMSLFVCQGAATAPRNAAVAVPIQGR